MKTKECLKRGLRLVEIGIKKATSYNMVKGRLSRGLYCDDYLQDRMKAELNHEEKEESLYQFDR